MQKENLLTEGRHEQAWKKYCGFLDFSISEFTTLQNHLLEEQIKLISRAFLKRWFGCDYKPENVDDFRRIIPLTSFSDYPSPGQDSDSIPSGEKPLFWLESMDKSGRMTCTPFTNSNFQFLADDVITALVLSSAGRRGNVRLKPSDRILVCLKLKVISDTISIALHQRLGCNNLTVPMDTFHFENDYGLNRFMETSFKHGLDYVIASSETLAWLGENSGFKTKSKWRSGLNINRIGHFVKTWLIKRFLHRPALAKDFWKTKGLVCCCNRLTNYRERIRKTWGVVPMEVYYTPETGLIGMQSWNKKDFTLLPYRNYFEFIPISELAREAIDEDYQPATVLMNELKQGEVYELVVSSFHGGPLLRYRPGDYLKVTALEDIESGIKLPQFALHSKPE
ncbi:MAG TPA: GH3 auxin-responsive promoter family protein [Dehalococcoidales bacterium]|nr:GH3 auxin-responsive promoter family protein [Dehalococcoidales bacterium]